MVFVRVFSSCVPSNMFTLVVSNNRETTQHSSSSSSSSGCRVKKREIMTLLKALRTKQTPNWVHFNIYKNAIFDQTNGNIHKQKKRSNTEQKTVAATTTQPRCNISLGSPLNNLKYDFSCRCVLVCFFPFHFHSNEIM